MLKLIPLMLCILTVAFSNAQTAMQLSGTDCNGNTHDLFADLDAGKAVVVFFFMPNCSSCPPPAKKVQAMANNVMAMHPGMVTGYVMPYNNSTSCGTAASWVTTNAVPFYMPYDSGATQVAYYGGFGMPTVVLLGGTDHRVMFATQSFSTSDTTIMRDSIMALLEMTTGVPEISAVTSAKVFPNPASDNAQIQLNMSQASSIKIELVNQLGEVANSVFVGRAETGILQKEIETATLANGLYVVRVTSGNQTQNYKLTVKR